MRLDSFKRYNIDPEFNALINIMLQYIERTDFTPTEIREAAMLAAAIFEYEHVRPICLDDGRTMEYIGPKVIFRKELNNTDGK